MMGCNNNGYGCRPYRDYDFNRRRERDLFCDSPYGHPCRRHTYDRDALRSRPSRGIFFNFPRFY